MQGLDQRKYKKTRGLTLELYDIRYFGVNNSIYRLKGPKRSIEGPNNKKQTLMINKF